MHLAAMQINCIAGSQCSVKQGRVLPLRPHLLTEAAAYVRKQTNAMKVFVLFVFRNQKLQKQMSANPSVQQGERVRAASDLGLRCSALELFL